MFPGITVYFIGRGLAGWVLFRVLIPFADRLPLLTRSTCSMFGFDARFEGG